MKVFFDVLIIGIAIPFHMIAQELFSNGINSSIYLTPMAIASGDFNNDGIADVVVSGKNDLDGSGVMTVLFGKGDGGFKSKIDMPTDKYAVDLVVVDMDKDGLPDIVTCNNSSQTVTIFMGQKSGGFKAKDPIKIKGEPGLIGVGDFTEDGKQDIAVILSSANELQIYKGTSYKLAGSKTLDAKPVALSVKDLTGSGHFHLLIAFEGRSELALIAPVETGSNKWDFPAVKLDMLTEPRFAQSGDINGDGFDDAIVYAGTGKGIEVHLSDLSGLILNNLYTLKTSDGVNLFSLGDFNNDKKTDIALLDVTQAQVTIHLNQTPQGSTETSKDLKGQMIVIYDNDFSKPNSFDMGMMSSYNRASMIIYNTDGKEVRKYFDFESDLPDGQQFALEWNGLDANDVAMPGGTYVFYYRLGGLLVSRVVKK
jgi:hypothetical protein